MDQPTINQCVVSFFKHHRFNRDGLQVDGWTIKDEYGSTNIAVKYHDIVILRARMGDEKKRLLIGKIPGYYQPFMVQFHNSVLSYYFKPLPSPYIISMSKGTLHINDSPWVTPFLHIEFPEKYKKLKELDISDRVAQYIAKKL